MDTARTLSNPCPAAARRLRAALLAGSALAGSLPAIALAGPEGGQVTQGAALISTPAAGQTRIQQMTDRVQIDWRGFSVRQGEFVTFAQPGASALAINRVTGPDPSAIAGRINANGQVVLINPNGVVFSDGAQVDVGGLIASTADINTAASQGRRLVFDRPSATPAASIVNRGTITVGGEAGKGFAALVAPGVVNDGVIAARAGTVILGGAETHTIDLHGDGRISFQIDSPTRTAPRDPEGRALPAAVVNRGRISAPQGTVLLAAETARGVINRAIDSQGVIEAHSVSAEGGRIRFSGGGTGDVVINGTVDATSAQGRGGGVEIAGAQIQIGANARINASGGGGGGRVSIGGDKAAPAQAARRVQMAAGARIAADATRQGRGGTIRIWSEQGTQIAGSLTARGMDAAGGTIETSARTGLAVSGHIDAGATGGPPGTWTLDPVDLVIDSAAAATISTSLGAGTSVTLDANAAGGGGGTITLDAAIRVTQGTSPVSLTLTAPGAITVNAPIESLGGPALSITLTSTGGTVSLAAGAGLTSNGGAISLSTPGAISLGGSAHLLGGGGAITLLGGGGVSIAGALDSGGGAMTIRGAGTLGGPVTGAVSLPSEIITAGGALQVASLSPWSTALTLDLGGGGATVSLGDGAGTLGAITLASGSLSLQVSGGLSLAAPISANGGAIGLTAAGNITIASAASLESGGGAVAVTSTGGSLSLTAPVSTGGGSLTLLGAQGVTLSGAIASGGGAVTIRGAADTGSTASAPISLSGQILTAGGGLGIDAGSGLEITGAIDVGAGGVAITLQSGTASLGGSVITSGDLVSVTATAAADITISGTIASGAAFVGSGRSLSLTRGGRIEAATDLRLAIDDLSIDTARSLASDGPALSATGSLQLRPLSAGRGFNFGGATETGGVLSVTAGEIATFGDYRNLYLGREVAGGGAAPVLMSGTLRLAGAYTAPAALQKIFLSSSGDVILEDGATVRAPSVQIDAARLLGGNAATVSAIATIGVLGGDLAINAPVQITSTTAPTVLRP